MADPHHLPSIVKDVIQTHEAMARIYRDIQLVVDTTLVLIANRLCVERPDSISFRLTAYWSEGAQDYELNSLIGLELAGGSDALSPTPHWTETIEVANLGRGFDTLLEGMENLTAPFTTTITYIVPLDVPANKRVCFRSEDDYHAYRRRLKQSAYKV